MFRVNATEEVLMVKGLIFVLEHVFNLSLIYEQNNRKLTKMSGGSSYQEQIWRLHYYIIYFGFVKCYIQVQQCSFLQMHNLGRISLTHLVNFSVSQDTR